MTTEVKIRDAVVNQSLKLSAHSICSATSDSHLDRSICSSEAHRYRQQDAQGSSSGSQYPSDRKLWVETGDCSPAIPMLEFCLSISCAGLAIRADLYSRQSSISTIYCATPNHKLLQVNRPCLHQPRLQLAAAQRPQRRALRIQTAVRAQYTKQEKVLTSLCPVAEILWGTLKCLHAG